MQLILEIKNLKDLQILLPLLERLKIVIKKSSGNLHESENEKQEKIPLSQLWGSCPSLDVNSFEQYIKQTRDEWEQPIS